MMETWVGAYLRGCWRILVQFIAGHAAGRLAHECHPYRHNTSYPRNRRPCLVSIDRLRASAPRESTAGGGSRVIPHFRTTPRRVAFPMENPSRYGICTFCSQEQNEEFSPRCVWTEGFLKLLYVNLIPKGFHTALGHRQPT